MHVLFVATIALAVLLARSDNAETARLKKVNQLLRSALGSMLEQEVGEELVGQSTKSTCGTMTGYQACTGPRHRLQGQATRRGNEQITTYIIYPNPTPKWEFCKLQCENMGIPGCCEWQEDHGICYFTAFESSTVGDSASRREYGAGFDYETVPLRYASVCSVSNCVYQMETVHDYFGSCDYDNLDSEGRMAKGGGGWTVDECMDWCLSESGCVFAARSPSGYCHGFKTCNHRPAGRGFDIKQKVCKGALEYNNHGDCATFLDPKYCLPPM